MTTNQGNSNIPAVDATPDNLRLLAAILSEKGYQVRPEFNGETALNTVKTVPPDVILSTAKTSIF